MRTGGVKSCSTTHFTRSDRWWLLLQAVPDLSQQHDMFWRRNRRGSWFPEFVAAQLLDH